MLESRLVFGIVKVCEKKWFEKETGSTNKEKDVQFDTLKYNLMSKWILRIGANSWAACVCCPCSVFMCRHKTKPKGGISKQRLDVNLVAKIHTLDLFLCLLFLFKHKLLLALGHYYNIYG